MQKRIFFPTDFRFLNCVGECADTWREIRKAGRYHITLIRQYRFYLLACCETTKEITHYGLESWYL